MIAKDVQAPLKTCADYISAQGDSRVYLEAQPDSDTSDLKEISTVCIASGLILNAKPSTVSYLETPLVTKAFLKNTPYNLAQIISDEELDRLKSRKPTPSWWSAEPIKAIKRFNDNVATLELDGSSQSVVVLGHGDINGDGVEDVVVRIIDTINPPASYFNSRLYVLTRLGKNEKYTVIRAYED